MEGIDEVENEAKMLKGELYYAFVPKLVEKRNRWGTTIIDDKTPLPPAGATDEEDFRILGDEPYIDGPINVDYGINLRYLANRARTLIGPSCSFYAATHPLDPFVRDGTNGPELGAPITVGEDCWFGGSVTVCPGVTIGRGCTIGAGSVVTKDVPDFHVAAGNPARIIRKIEPKGLNPN
ncbi:hypothetical protein SS1G_13554 [Sclerotinia sclerotiorum 1980 UF-70]|uniref:Uncharacterized protein n=1 Tax=Sclerotinia sclerotiorum (strain ATCC 18683 / 1980 / Ss-1) TaxID=665079 RepID=A7F7H4_SCLS1|nr:hypothetical protein SS1G_13554 [Sclerotinia sclerotiorum 1980 UF-70]EDN98695.1 hypothetical protein SS1G_13554 [Sclerotinia sclerotiorum 1980 UF-70]